jgi:hypothetical protein
MFVMLCLWRGATKSSGKIHAATSRLQLPCAAMWASGGTGHLFGTQAYHLADGFRYLQVLCHATHMHTSRGKAQ